MRKSTIIAATLIAASTPSLAAGPTPADIVAFSAMFNALDDAPPSTVSASFIEGIRLKAWGIAVAVAARDFPELTATWKSCVALQVTDDGGQTYHYPPAHQAMCAQIANSFEPLLSAEFDALSQASAGSGV